MKSSTILKGHDIFANLNVDEINKMSHFSSEKKYKKGEMIFQFGKPSSHFYILLDGEVFLQIPSNPPEFKLAVSKVAKGELFGISPLLDSPKYTLTALCFKNARVLSVESKPFLKMLRENSSAGLTINNQVAHIYFHRYLDLIQRLQNVMGQITTIH